MSATMKPIILHGDAKAPNPWKVVMILEELELPYEHKFVDFALVKQEPYILLNPNGRLPTIEDPNTGLTLWESGAIIEYLVETYDKDNKISFTSFPEKFLLKQYLHFQMSGQGPYYGQLGWFKLFHPEKVESALKRYEEQVFRVVSVLDKILEGKQWLVGNKCTFADIAFIPWEQVIRFISPETLERYKEYPNYSAWFERVTARPAIAKASKLRAEAFHQ
ncbi:glutathione S-transferase [Xylariales sp. PMI_506]|nr:glutathione S-transferase [Xylariales sp. PMI_506]